MTEDEWLSALGPTWNWESFRSEIAALDRGLGWSLADLPRLARGSRSMYGAPSCSIQPGISPVSGAALPVMPAPEIQTSWTGSHGGTLLRQSVAFIRSLVAAAGDDL